MPDICEIRPHCHTQCIAQPQGGLGQPRNDPSGTTVEFYAGRAGATSAAKAGLHKARRMSGRAATKRCIVIFFRGGN